MRKMTLEELKNWELQYTPARAALYPKKQMICIDGAKYYSIEKETVDYILGRIINQSMDKPC